MASLPWITEGEWRAYRRRIEAMRRPELIESLELEARLRGAAVQLLVERAGLSLEDAMREMMALARASSDGAG